MAEEPAADGVMPVAEDGQKYRVVRSPGFTPAQFALARRYTRLEDALADMGEGLVVADDGHVAAFHERHEPVLARRAAASAPGA